MEVQAATEGGIEIAYTNAAATSGSYSTSATAGATAASVLAPTSTLDTTAWYHASAKLATASEARPESYKTLTGITESAISGQAFGKLGGVTADSVTTNYYMVQTFNIRSTSATALAKGLTVDSVTVAGNTANMSEALRVAVVLSGGKTLIYDPVKNDQTAYAVYSGFTGDGSEGSPYTATKAGDVTCKDATTQNLLASAATTEIPAKTNDANGGVDVQIYIWFEGEDAQLYSENFATEGLKVTVNFSATV